MTPPVLFVSLSVLTPFQKTTHGFELAPSFQSGDRSTIGGYHSAGNGTDSCHTRIYSIN